MSGKTSKTKWAAVIAGAFVVLTAVGCGGGTGGGAAASATATATATAKTGHTVMGTVDLMLLGTGPAAFTTADRAGGECHGTGGYDDMDKGLGVTLRDGEGTILATSRLGPGDSAAALFCRFTFTLDNVPEVPFYSVEVGRRGELTYSLADMKSKDWALSLTLN